MPLYTTTTPGQELDYVAFTSDVSITATAEASADTVVTANAITCDGVQTILIEFYTPSLRPAATAGAVLRIWLYDGTSIGMIARSEDPVTGVFVQGPGYVARRLTPTAASHTYSIRATVSTGTGTVAAGAGGLGNLMPGFIRITRV